MSLKYEPSSEPVRDVLVGIEYLGLRVEGLGCRV